MRKRGVPRSGDGAAVAGPPRAGEPGGGDSARPPAVRRAARDRRSRGLRGAPWTSGPARATTAGGLAPGTYGPLAPPGSPLAVTRAERFADLVSDARERLEPRWERELATVEFAVAPVPPAPAADLDPALAGVAPLARHYPGGAGQPARIVLYRRPVEARASTRQDLDALVHDLVVEQVAELLGLETSTVDPNYPRSE